MGALTMRAVLLVLMVRRLRRGGIELTLPLFFAWAYFLRGDPVARARGR